MPPTLLELSSTGRWAEVQELIRQGIPPNQINAASRSDGLTPLHHAALEEKVAVVKSLVCSRPRARRRAHAAHAHTSRAPHARSST